MVFGLCLAIAKHLVDPLRNVLKNALKNFQFNKLDDFVLTSPNLNPLPNDNFFYVFPYLGEMAMLTPLLVRKARTRSKLTFISWRELVPNLTPSTRSPATNTCMYNVHVLRWSFLGKDNI